MRNETSFKTLPKGASETKNSVQTGRRSLVKDASTTETVQHCRAGQLQDLLVEMATIAPVANWLLSRGLDGEAIEALDTFVEVARAIALTARDFKAAHALLSSKQEAAR